MKEAKASVQGIFCLIELMKLDARSLPELNSIHLWSLVQYDDWRIIQWAQNSTVLCSTIGSPRYNTETERLSLSSKRHTSSTIS